MTVQDNNEFSTLQWVLPELELALAGARESLEACVGDPGATDAMRACADDLHQVQGTLRMVELPGATLAAEEMEALARALLGHQAPQREEACAALMRGLMQLSDYLERIASGHRDVPIVLLPLLNDLRANRGLPALSDAAMFRPNLDAFLPPQAPAAMSEAQANERQADHLASLRAQFQQHLLAWFRGQAPEASLSGMRGALLGVAARCFHVHGRRLWWIAAGVVEGLEQGVLASRVAELRQLLGKVDRFMRLLIEQGESSLRGGEADELCNRMLHIVAQAPQRSPHMELLQRTYALDKLLPDTNALERARGSMAGQNRALFDSVARALRDDLLHVREALDLFQRRPDADPTTLAPQCDQLKRVSDTLDMLALPVPRRVVDEQRQLLDEIVARRQVFDEDTLLDVAGALLYVEAALDDHVESMGEDGAPRTADESPGLPRSEAQGALGAVVLEAIRNIGKVKESIVAFVESGWNHADLAGVPASLSEVAGAVRMLSAERPADLAEAIGRFVHNELLVDRRVPDSLQMGHLADALAALEYYLEAVREHRGGLAHIIDVAESSLSELGYWPAPAERPLPAMLAAADAASNDEAAWPFDSHATPAAATESLTPAEVVSADRPHGAAEMATGSAAADDHTTGTVAVSGDGLAANFHFDHNAEGIDDDIRQIFLEEMQDEITSLHGTEAVWLQDPANLESLTPVRRSFHTLKGSGRLVGIAALGEFAWAVENMLNRVLDRTIEPHDGVQALVHHAIAALPSLLSAIKGERAAPVPVDAIEQTAGLLANGDASARIEDRLPAPATLDEPVAEPAAEAVAEQPASTVVDAEAPVSPAATLPSVDPVLLEILRAEVAQYLQTIRDAVNRHAIELPVDEELMRAVHTMHGAIAMAEIPTLTSLLSPLETLLKRVRGAGLPLTAEGIALLGHSADAVGQTMDQFDAAIPHLPDVEALTGQVAALRDRYPESSQPRATETTRALLGGEMPPSSPVAEGAAAAVEIVAPHDHYALELGAALEAFTPSAPTMAESEHAEQERVEQERVAQERAEQEHAEQERVEQERAAQERAEQERAEQERAAQERAEQERAEQERVEQERAAQERAEQERVAQERAEQERVAQERAEQERAEQERVAQERAEQERAEQERVAQERAEQERVEQERVEQERVAQERAEQERAEQERAEQERVEQEHAEQERIERERAEQNRIEHERAEQERIKQARADQEQAEHAQSKQSRQARKQAARDAALALKRAAAAQKRTAAGQAVAALPVAALQTPIQPVAPPVAAAPLATSVDADLLEVFAEEANEILDHADGILTQWHAAPEETSHLAELQRDLHTLKGGARIAGLMPIGDLAHAIETLLGSASRNPAQVAPLVDELEGSFDQLHAMVQQVVDGHEPTYPKAALDRLQAIAGGQPVATVGGHHDEPAPLPEPLLADAGSHAGQELIRVRAELLDNLVNDAGEVAIYRSRLEQQVSGYRFNLIELDQTVQRLRGQLRKLEIETEAQIIARYQHEHREAGSTTGFDPLELDRFSQLQQYSRGLAESVSDLVAIQSMLDELTRQAEGLLIQQSRASTELQEGLLRTRMLPFDSMVPNLRRTLRQAAREEGKQARLYVDGAHGEMDRNLLERIKAPFEHMLRNAVAHGIESPENRAHAGKPAEGVVHIRVAREATEVVIRVSDDGRGLNREAIRARGVERGLLAADAQPDDEQLLALIAQPGFSTASTVTQLAGRGVGMDVVANEIKQLGGVLGIESQPGHGTTFVLRLPFTLAVTQAILVRTGESTFAIPMTSVQGVARIDQAELTARLADPEPAYIDGEERYDIHDLAELLGLPPGTVPEGELPPLLLARAGGQHVAIRIDAVLGSREIVVKSVGPQVSSVPGVLGATIMGDGSVLVILDLAPLVRHNVARREQRLAEGLVVVAPPAPVEKQRGRAQVMVVDDSITMRKVTGRVLERHEYEVSTAKDGVDALEKLAERVPDLMLLDIEMPRMDGYELATHMKADPRLRDVPIIMITSRTGEKHRQRAFDIGVDRYLGKPYQEADLLAEIESVLEQRALAGLETETDHG